MNNEPNISLYDADAMEDFPVLKAFQQYIDAEQAKARRRLLTVSIVFVITLIVVIAIFSMMVVKANNQTQIVNDRMFELLLKDKDRAAENAKAAAIQELSVKNLNEAISKLKDRLESQELKSAQTAASVQNEEASRAALRAKNNKRQEEIDAKIQKALALLKAEKAKLQAEKERLRNEELERYRRQQYPEYYAKKEAAAKSSEKKVLTYEDVLDEEPDATKPVAKEIDFDDDDAIEYFNDEEDNIMIPVEVKGKRAGWRVPLD